MILKLLLLLILLYILSRRFETMRCKDVVISDPPVTSVYDVTGETGNYKNKKFAKEYSSYKHSLKTYFANLKKYCTII